MEEGYGRIGGNRMRDMRSYAFVEDCFSALHGCCWCDRWDDV